MTLEDRISVLTLNASSIRKVESVNLTTRISCQVRRADGLVVTVDLADYLTGMAYDIADIARALGQGGLSE